MTSLQPADGRARAWTTLAAVPAAVTAIASTGLWRLPSGAGLAAAAAVVLLGLVPLAVVVGGRPRFREASAVAWAASGVALTAGGVAAAALRDRGVTSDLVGWRDLAQSPQVVGPLVLAVLGLALLGAAPGLLRSRRGAVVGLALVAAVGAVVLATTLLGAEQARDAAVAGSDVPGTVTRWGSLSAGALGLSALSLLVIVWRRDDVVTWGRVRPGPPAHGSRRALGRASAAVVGTLVLGLGLSTVWHDVPGTVLADEVPDPVLASCLATAARTLPQVPVSSADLARVTTVECPVAPGGHRVVDLTGIELFPGLVTLDLTGHAVRDLRPLAGLASLWSLKLTGNEVRDLSPLTGLAALTDLGLSGNAVRDVGPLAGSLVAYLGLAGNTVSDVTPLGSVVGLTDLDLSGNPVEDVTALASLPHLDRLTLRSTQVVDPAPLAGAPVLRVLDVSCSRVADAARFAGLDAVAELWIGGNPLDDVAPLVALPSLVGVDLAGTAHEVQGRDELEATGVYVGGTAKGVDCPGDDDGAW